MKSSKPRGRIGVGRVDAQVYLSRIFHTRIESTFSHTHKVGNNGVKVNLVFPYICRFLNYLYLKMLVKVKLDVS